jgi:hypothetical protein
MTNITRVLQRRLIMVNCAINVYPIIVIVLQLLIQPDVSEIAYYIRLVALDLWIFTIIATNWFLYAQRKSTISLPKIVPIIRPPNVPEVSISIEHVAEQRNNTKTCSICFDVFDDNTKITTACTHQFHKTCLTQWIEKCMDGNKPSSCPLCKAVFVVSKD